VDYTPWLDVGTDASATTPGFQGSFAVLHAGPAGAQVGGTGRIDEAIGLTTGTSPHVIAEAGTFSETVHANKTNLLLSGVTDTPADVTINAGGGTGVTVSADNVTLQDFRITGAGSALSASTLNTLTITDLASSGNTSGGSVSNVTTVVFNGSGGADTLKADGN